LVRRVRSGYSDIERARPEGRTGAVARIAVVFCDLHLEKGERVQAEELPPITIEGKGPRVLALCPEHKRDFYDPFVELVDDLGQDVPAKKAE
jgi:hypothetical protein